MLIADMTLRVKTEGRALARKLGLLSPLARVKGLVDRLAGRDGYERAFDDALRAEVRSGDVIWDVGANLGLYTRMFSEAAGPSGLVCGFEPVSSCFEELKRRCEGRSNVRLFGLALGDREAELPMWVATDPLGATHSLVARTESLTNQTKIDVRVAPGDALITAECVPTPNVIKVDVEGFEEEVLLGLQNAISRPECRAVFVEVHFAVLEGRGTRHAPARIQRFLSDKGFRVRWTDSSHLAARRAS